MDPPSEEEQLPPAASSTCKTCIEVDPCCGCLPGAKFRRAIVAVGLIGFFLNLLSFIADDIQLAQVNNRRSRLDGTGAQNSIVKVGEALAIIAWLTIFTRLVSTLADLTLLFRVKRTLGTWAKRTADKCPFPYVLGIATTLIMVLLHFAQLVLSLIRCKLRKESKEQQFKKPQGYHLFYFTALGHSVMLSEQGVDSALSALSWFYFGYIFLRIWFTWIVMRYRSLKVGGKLEEQRQSAGGSGQGRFSKKSRGLEGIESSSSSSGSRRSDEN